MSRRYSFDDGEELPRPGQYQPEPYVTAPPSQYQPYDPPRPQLPPISTQQNRSVSSPEYQPYAPHSPTSPSGHPDSQFNKLRAARRYSRDQQQQQFNEPIARKPISPSGPVPPPAPPHRDAEGRVWGRELGYTNSTMSNITPGADNFGEQAAGGIAGIALGVADTHARESGLDAMRNMPGYNPNQMHRQSYQDSPFADPRPVYEPYGRPQPRPENSHSSLQPLGAAAIPPAMVSPHPRSIASATASSHTFNNDPYSDNPYEMRHSRNLDSDFDPNIIEDDGDDGLEYTNRRRSRISLGRHSDPAAAAAGGAAAGGILGSLGGLVGRTASGNQVYNPVQNTAYGGPNNYDLGTGPEKSAWLNKQSKGNKKMAWLIGAIAAFLVIGGIVGGVVGGVLLHNKNSSASAGGGGGGQSAGQDTQANGDLNINSPEIQALMNNKNLHKVFPGIDYTPMYTQYPGCLSYPASQNNVTRDLAVLSQLTNTVRLYGTDCNQTELLLHSINQLNLNGTVKVWLGVWQDTNATTNARQLEQMYNILETYGTSPFVGVIIGNEVLFRQDMTATELGTVISGVKANFTAKGWTLPVASSDLGDDWTKAPALATQVDYVMSNIHPFFAGVTAEVAASWTWDFWTQYDTPLKTDMSKNIIAETGWPSAGGMDCGSATTCTNGSIAGIAEMNTFMEGWVCDALTNGTNYFWFEAFDEPWKIKFDTTGKEWEDKWGLMDVNRNLKAGVSIPDCGGKTVS